MTTGQAKSDEPRSGFGGHAVPAASPAEGMFGQLKPLVEVPAPRRRSAAEEARTILDPATVGALATLTDAGDPWASVVTYGSLADCSPVLLLSHLALHGRNLKGDRRASLAVSEAIPAGQDPADSGRVTLAGVAEEPQGEELERARDAYERAIPSASLFGDFGDFTLWVLRLQRVRWVGGFGRMDSVTPAQLAAAEADPVAAQAPHAVAHLNADHADSLLLFARALAGYTDASAASCVRAVRYGLDLNLVTDRGETAARVGFPEPIQEPDGLRAATIDLVKRARSAA